MKKVSSIILIIAMLSALFINTKAAEKVEVDENFRYIVYVVDEKVYYLDHQQMKDAATAKGATIYLPNVYENKLLQVLGEGASDVYHCTSGIDRFVTEEFTVDFFAESEERGRCNYKITFVLTDDEKDLNADCLVASGNIFLFVIYYLEGSGYVFLTESQIEKLENNKILNIEVNNVENGEEFGVFYILQDDYRFVSSACSTNYNEYVTTEMKISIVDKKDNVETDYKLYVNYAEHKTSIFASYVQSLADNGVSESFLRIADLFNRFLFLLINKIFFMY